jgi:hypothetical protein
MKKLIIIALSLAVTFISCNKNSKPNEGIIIAEAYGNKLYLSDLNDLFGNVNSKEDSIAIINNQIDIWVKKQVFLRQAEINLDNSQKDVDAIVEDYKASLLIERYKEEFLKQKLDTVVTDFEIKQYYKGFQESFRLNKTIVKADFLKFPTSYSDISNFRRSFFSEEDDEYENAFKLAEKNAVKIENFDKKWVSFSEISSLLPTKISSPEVILKSAKKIQTQDNDFYYFVRIYDYRLTDEYEPIENVKEQISIIIMNKRKVELLGELEKVIYDKALDKGNIKIY